jgi:Fe-S oxidoreductase
MFCCGAGGAQMFKDKNGNKEINIERTEDALNKTRNNCSGLSLL